MNINTLVSTYPEFLHRLSLKDVLSVEQVCKFLKRVVERAPTGPMLATARTVNVMVSKATHLLNRSATNHATASKHCGSGDIKTICEKYPELKNYMFATSYRNNTQNYIR